MWGKRRVPRHQGWPRNFKGSTSHMAVCQNLVPLVNIKIAGKWMFIPLKMVLMGIDPYPYHNHFESWLNIIRKAGFLRFTTTSTRKGASKYDKINKPLVAGSYHPLVTMQMWQPRYDPRRYRSTKVFGAERAKGNILPGLTSAGVCRSLGFGIHVLQLWLKNSPWILLKTLACNCWHQKWCPTWRMHSNRSRSRSPSTPGYRALTNRSSGHSLEWMKHLEETESKDTTRHDWPDKTIKRCCLA